MRLIVGPLCCLAFGAFAAGWLNRTLELEAEPWPAPPIIALPPSSEREPLRFRLVDLGAVGIPTDTAAWGEDYSHHSKAFARLILDRPPYIDPGEFARVREDWTTYVHRMAAFGNNGIVVPLFLELVAFEKRPRIYQNTDYALRHQTVRAKFRELFAIAQDAGLAVYLYTDLAPLTPPLATYLNRAHALAPSDSLLWATYRDAFAELFEQVPEVQGVVLRTGEAGKLYGRPDWPYGSQYLISSVNSLRTMLHQLLPVFEASGRKLILRNWSVGVGDLGDFHTNPATYARALDDIDSPILIVSTKFQAGDFFRPLPLNPTLLTGRHQRIVEFQARREFEASSAFPNYLGSLHAGALDAVRSANPNLVGSWLWTQNGGPLRAGPMSLYPRHGFWLWIDANVYVTSQLALGSPQGVEALTREWVRRELTRDALAVEALTELLLRSPRAVDLGYYIEPFAQRRVTIGGMEVPPLLWIMEWDVVGGWSAVWSAIYSVTRLDFDVALRQGFDAVAEVDSLRLLLPRARPGLVHRPDLLRQMERSLAYERSLLEALAWYRAAFLTYYRWLDTGDGATYWSWRAALPQFRRSAAAHQAAFGRDLDFPAFDFTAALSTAHLARRATESRWVARGAAALLVLLLLLGAVEPLLPPQRRGRIVSAARAMFVGAVAPWDLPAARLPVDALLSATGMVLLSATTAAALILCFTLPWGAAAVPLALGVLVVVLKAGLTGLRQNGERDAVLAAALSPLIWLVLLLFIVMSWRGPHHFWYLLWDKNLLRSILISAFVAVPLWTLVALAIASRRATGQSRAAAVGSVVMAASAALLLVAAMAPGLERFLAGLDRPLGLAPMTHAIVIGIQTYTRLPAIASWYPIVVAVLLLAGGALAFGAGRWRRDPK